MTSITESMISEMEESASSENKSVWELVSGRKVEFTEVIIPADEVADVTYVHEHNRRIQGEVKSKSIAGMVISIAKQQYYPCIAQKVGDKYLITDGSRRRLAAIEAKSPLRLMSCEEELTTAEVKGLAKELQSSEEHSYRDHGCYYELLLSDEANPMTKEQIIIDEGISESHYKRSINAWSVPSELVELFEWPSKLSHSDFVKLVKVTKKYPVQSELLSFVESVQIETGTSNKEVLGFIVEAAGLNKKIDSTRPRKVVDINKDKFVKVKSVKHKTTFEISRGTPNELKDIENLIVEYYKQK